MASVNYYRKLFDQLGDAVIVADAHNRIDYANNAVANLLGWPRENLVGQSLIALAPPDRDVLTDGFDWRKAINDPELAEQAVRLPMHRRDGVQINVELTLSPLPAGDGETLVVGLLRHAVAQPNPQDRISALDCLRIATQALARSKPREPVNSLCQAIADTLKSDFAATRAELWLPNPTTGEIKLCAVAGQFMSGVPFPRTDADMAAYVERLTAVTRTGQPEITTDLSFAHMAALDQPAPTAALILPFWLGANQGVLVYWASDSVPGALVDALMTFMTLAGARLHECRLRGELKIINQASEESRALLDSLFSAAPMGLAFLDNTLRCVRINDTLAALDGSPAEAHLGRTVVGRRGALGEQTKDLRLQVLNVGTPVTDIELAGEMPAEPSEQRHWLVNYYPVRSRGGDALGIAAVVVEITERKKAEALLRERCFLEAVLQSLKDGIVACDAEGNLIIVNQTIQDFQQPSAASVTPDRWAEYYDLFLPNGVTRMAKEDVPLFRVLAGQEVRDVEMVMALNNGEKRVFICNGQAIYNKLGRKLGAVVAMHDITEQRQAEARLTRQAQSDPLTGLPNRLKLVDKLQETLDDAALRPESVAVLFLDLDYFKKINDSLGHEAGDHALITIAKRLQGALREADTLARLGGDEFVILCADLAGAQEATDLAKRIQKVVSAPLVMRGQATEMTITVSIGIAFSHGDKPAGDLIRDADQAMYQAKQRGRACYVLLNDDSGA